VESPYGQHHYDPVKSVVKTKRHHGRQSHLRQLPEWL